MTISGVNNLFKNTGYQILAAVTGTLVAASDGMSYGWTSPMIPRLLDEETTPIKTTHTQAEWLETIALLGAFCGLPFTIYFVDKIGRKKSLLLAAVVVLLSWIAILVADRIEYIFVARFFLGMAGDMSFVAAPMYIAEIADQKIRGFLSSIIYLMMLLGVLMVYTFGHYAPFYVPSVIGIVLTAVQLLVFTFMPESPYYLLYKNQPEQAKESLIKFRGGADVDKELEDISKAIERQKAEKGRPQDLILVASNRKAIIIMTVLNGGQHLACISVMYMNLHPILEQAGSIYIEGSIAAILFAFIMLVASLIASFTIDKFGRKVILASSSFLTGFCLLALAVYFHLQKLGYDVSSISWIPIVSVLVYAGAFKFGIGLVPIVITAEIFPAPMKAIGMTVADVMFVLGGILAIQIYQQLQSLYGMHVPFYIFTVCAFLVAVFSMTYIPETKGKSLDEIQMMLKGKKIEKTHKVEAAEIEQTKF